LLLPVNTGEPLSPPCTITVPGFCTIVWQSNWMFDPDTFTVAHVFVTFPDVQPVVRPTFCMVPLKVVLVLFWPVMLKWPSTTRDPELIPVVLAIRAWLSTPVTYSARAASL
jgi:hypothetical protein